MLTNFDQPVAMEKVPMIHTSWLKPFAEYFADRGKSLKRYSEPLQIPLEAITKGDGWITKVQLYDFLEALAEGENMPEVGYVVGEYLTPETLGELGSAILNQSTLGGAIRLFSDLINRHVEGNFCWIEEGDQGEVWMFNEKSPSEKFGRTIADQAGLLSMINLTRLVAGRDWYPKKARLQTPDTGSHKKVEGLCQVHLEFNANATGYAFPAVWLLESFDGKTTAAGRGNRFPGLIAEDSSLPSKLELILEELLGVGGICPTASMMATICGLSERTFHRELEKTGKNYRALLDELRYDRARDRLTGSDIAIKELAFDLGYSGANNFIRAFRRHSGMTPSEYRKSQLAS